MISDDPKLTELAQAVRDRNYVQANSQTSKLLEYILDEQEPPTYDECCRAREADFTAAGGMRAAADILGLNKGFPKTAKMLHAIVDRMEWELGQ